MSRLRIEEMMLESGLGADESLGMADALGALGALDAFVTEAPEPSAELAALFGATDETSTVRSLTSRTRASAVAGVVVLALSGVGATGLSAAANTLPRPLQHHVSEFSKHYLPFDLPEPPPRTSRPSLSADTPSDPHAGDPVDEASRSVDAQRQPVIESGGMLVQRPALAPGAATGRPTRGETDDTSTDAGQVTSPTPRPSAAPSPTPSAQPTPSTAPKPSSSPKPAKGPTSGSSSNPKPAPVAGKPPSGGTTDPGDPGGKAPQEAPPAKPVPDPPPTYQLPDLPPLPSLPGTVVPDEAPTGD